MAEVVRLWENNVHHGQHTGGNGAAETQARRRGDYAVARVLLGSNHRSPVPGTANCFTPLPQAPRSPTAASHSSKSEWNRLFF